MRDSFDQTIIDERTAEIERLRKALETAAARFNMMGGVGLVNGADPKVGYRECMDVLAVVGTLGDKS